MNSVLLGGIVTFAASVSNTADKSVSWKVNGIPGGSAQLGTITTDGAYTAPADLPTSGVVQVTATSHADPTKSANASVSITSDVVVGLTPGSSTVELGATLGFQATISSAGHPDAALRWSLSGPSCPNSCGGVDSNGNYTAPQILPANTGVTITATSVADPAKQASATVSISSNFTLVLNAPASVVAGDSQALVAKLTAVPGSHPATALSWSLSSTSCNAAACGILQVTTTQSAGGNGVADTATYTAPSTPPQPEVVTVTVTPQADPTKKTQANITIQPGSSLVISPSTATLAATHRVTLTVTGITASAGNLVWSVNGIAGGNVKIGQICIVGSNPCQSVSSGVATQVDYMAPGALPSSNPVSVTVASAENPPLTASSQITVINHIVVSVLPNNIILPPLGVQGFSASVLGANNQAVVWQIQGGACTAIGSCGSITTLGAYTAPSISPNPNSFQIIAISQDDQSQSASATVTISSGANIQSLHPASVYQGAADGFTLRVDGSGFAPSPPGPGSVLVIGNSSRVTTCATSNSCFAPVTPADVAQNGSLTIQIQNPDGTLSNAVQMAVVTPSSSEDVLSLTAAAPSVSGKDIVVVEPTTAGLDSVGSNVDLNVAALGSFATATNTCALAGSPIPFSRPPSGITAVDICVFSESGFDTSMNYSVSGNDDVSVIAKQPAGLGIIHLTLQVPANAVTGARTLFIQNTNLDLTAASGVLEIQ